MALGALVVLSGCSPISTPESTVGAPEGASAEHAAALEDGVITEDEYSAGWRRFVTCLADKGYTVMELGRPSTVYEGGIPDAAVKSGADEYCYSREYSNIDAIWQGENPARTIASDRMIACLTAAGVEDTSGNENELQQKMVDSGLSIGECIDPHYVE